MVEGGVRGIELQPDLRPKPASTTATVLYCGVCVSSVPFELSWRRRRVYGVCVCTVCMVYGVRCASQRIRSKKSSFSSRCCSCTLSFRSISVSRVPSLTLSLTLTTHSLHTPSATCECRECRMSSVSSSSPQLHTFPALSVRCSRHEYRCINDGQQRNYEYQPGKCYHEIWWLEWKHLNSWTTQGPNRPGTFARRKQRSQKNECLCMRSASQGISFYRWSDQR